MSGGRGGGPALWRFLARVLLGRRDADRLLNALDEEYDEVQRPEVGRNRADAWYRRQVLASLRPLLAGRRGLKDRLRGVMSDVAFGLRQLARHRLFAAVALFTLALGIGANTALFSVVRSVLLSPLPYDAPDRIYRAWAHADDGSITDFSFRVSELRTLAEREGGFEAVGAEFATDATVLIPGEDPVQVPARMVSAGFFDVFGVQPARGRMFAASEIEDGQALLAVTSWAFAERHFGGADGAVGQSLPLGTGTYTVVGVLPRDYEHVSDASAGLFLPYTIGTSGWTAHWLDLYVRVRPSVSAERAADEINAVMRSVAEVEARSRGWHATVEPLSVMVWGDVRTAVVSVFGTATLVLLIAGVNVAILALARSLTRRDELALRTALGAGRRRVVSQLLVENLTLHLVGGVAGVAFAWIGVKLLVAAAPASVPRLADATVDVAVLAFALIATVVLGVGFGMIPALSAVPRTAARPFGGRTTTPGRNADRLFGALIAAQVALAVTLLIGAVLLIDGFRTLQREDMGFERGGAVAFRTVVPRARYPAAADVYAFYERLRGELLGLSGVTAVGSGTDLPVSGEGAVANVTTQARLDAGIDEPVAVLQRRATEGYFEALGTRVADGRGFDSRDRADVAPVLVISASLADQLFPGESAVGKRLLWGSDPATDDWVTVVGVVQDVRYRGADMDQHPQVYQAHAQSAVREMAVIVRTTADPSTLIEPARAVLRRLDDQIPMYSVTTLRALVDRSVAARRFTMQLFSVFAFLALVLTASGVFGTLMFAVQQRRREIGVRMALGAGDGAVSRMMIARALRMVLIGLAIGVPGAVAVYRLLDSLLYRVSPLDPGAYLAGAGLLCAVAILAAYLPARAATSVTPMSVLRKD